MTRPSKTLDYKRAGPYRVRKVINKNDYRLDLPSMMRIHNFFHVSLLDKYSPPTIGQPPSGRQLTVVNDSAEWEVE
jgi:hypothetical protein